MSRSQLLDVWFHSGSVIEIFGVGILLDRYGAVPIIVKPEDILDINPLVPILGLGNLVLGPVLAWVLLRQRRWMPLVAGIAGAGPPSALVTRTMPFIQGCGVQW